MRNPRPIWLTPNAGRLYSDVVSLFTMSIDPKIKTSNWTVKQQMLLNGQIVCFLNSLLYLKECSSVLVECNQTTATRRRLRANNLVGRGGLEPPTSRLSGVRSNHLSYRPNEVEVRDFSGGAHHAKGTLPKVTICSSIWWSVSGSNR